MTMSEEKDLQPSAARLFEACSQLHGLNTPSKIAKELNVSPQVITNWSYKQGVSRKGAELAEKTLGISRLWVLEGVGEMRASDQRAVNTANAVIAAAGPDFKLSASTLASIFAGLDALLSLRAAVPPEVLAAVVRDAKARAADELSKNPAEEAKPTLPETWGGPDYRDVEVAPNEKIKVPSLFNQEQKKKALGDD